MLPPSDRRDRRILMKRRSAANNQFCGRITGFDAAPRAGQAA
jgi:hypothetical protein